MAANDADNSKQTELLYRSKSMEELLAILNFTSKQEFIEFYGYDQIDVVHRLSDMAVLILSVIYAVVFVLGLGGNTLLITVVALKRSMRYVINIFNVSLAIADLMIIVFCIPFTLLEQVTEDWVLGWFMCKLLNYITTVSVVSSILTMTAIAVERHSAICQPLRSKVIQTPRRAILWSLVIWCVAFTVNIPLFVFIDTKHYQHPFRPDVSYEFCEWRSIAEEKRFSVTCVLALYFAPLVFICGLYTGIARKLWMRNAVAPLHDMQTRMDVAANASIRKKKRATIMLALVVVLYAICWLPYHLFILVRDFRVAGIEDSEITRCLMASLQLLGLSNSCNNPIVYGFMNDKFKTNIAHLLWKPTPKSSSPGIRKKKPQPQSPHQPQLQKTKEGQFGGELVSSL